ncbi:hypothetical protein C8Q74DRAFT_1193673, partial [Fomes fomentarius]
GGGARYRYPYLKQVWSPAGGWWTRPAHWNSNTAIAFAEIFAVAYGVFTVSAATQHPSASSDAEQARSWHIRL